VQLYCNFGIPIASVQMVHLIQLLNLIFQEPIFYMYCTLVETWNLVYHFKAHS
jgi:hypothetical protein